MAKLVDINGKTLKKVGLLYPHIDCCAGCYPFELFGRTRDVDFGSYCEYLDCRGGRFIEVKDPELQSMNLC